MNQQIEKFNPTKAEIQAAVLEVEGLKINGIDDVAGYEAVKVGKKKLADYRIEITKFGKKQREEAIAWQKEVLRQEKELLAMIEPTEVKLKEQLEGIDHQKKREERRVLLPSRKKMLEEIGAEWTDEEILDMDEKEFASEYGSLRMEYDAEKAEKKRKEEEEKRHAEEMEKAKEEAAKKATEEAERKAKEELEKVERAKQAEIDKIKRDQEEKDRKEKEEAGRKKKEEEDRIAEEKAKQEKEEKNRKYKAWLKKNGVTDTNIGNFHIERLADNEQGTTFKLYEYKDLITIK